MSEADSVKKALLLSPEFLKADWPSFEWKDIVADDPNIKKGRTA